MPRAMQDLNNVSCFELLLKHTHMLNFLLIHISMLVNCTELKLYKKTMQVSSRRLNVVLTTIIISQLVCH